MQEPSINLRETRGRICAAVRLVKPFTELQEANSRRLIQYAREHHLQALLFYSKYGKVVAEELVSSGRISALVEFEETVHALSAGDDLEKAYRYYRDQFMALYDSAFPGSTGPHVDAARKKMAEEHKIEADSGIF